MGSGIGKRADNKATTALGRVEALETNLQSLLEAMQQTFGQVENRLKNLDELCSATATVIGVDVVRDAVVENRKARQEAEMAAAKAGLEKALEEKKLLPTVLPTLAEIEADDAREEDQPSLCDKYLVVGKELDAQLNVMAPGRIQLPFSRLLKDVKVKLAGCGADTTIDTVDGRKFVLEGVYFENPEPPALETDLVATGFEGVDRSVEDPSKELPGFDPPEAATALPNLTEPSSGSQTADLTTAGPDAQ